MVIKTLTNELIEAGETLIKILDNGRGKPEAALWFYFSDIEQWKLMMAYEDLSVKGPKKYYKEIQSKLLPGGDDQQGLSLENVVLAGSDATIIRLIRTMIRTGPGISGIRFTNNSINGTVIEDAYIYRI